MTISLTMQIGILLGFGSSCPEAHSMAVVRHLTVVGSGTENIIQAILGRKSMEKITVTDEEIFHIYEASDHKK